jgi:hypothetical protein
MLHEAHPHWLTGSQLKFGYARVARFRAHSTLLSFQGTGMERKLTTIAVIQFGAFELDIARFELAATLERGGPAI